MNDATKDYIKKNINLLQKPNTYGKFLLKAFQQRSRDVDALDILAYFIGKGVNLLEYIGDTIPASGFSACGYDGNFLNLEIPNNIINIGRQAFQGSTIKSVKMPSVKKIDSQAFKDCELLERVDMPSVEYLGSSAFERCNSLQSIFIPDTISRLPINLFKYDDDIMIYANSRKDTGNPLRCVGTEIEFYKNHLYMKGDDDE